MNKIFKSLLVGAIAVPSVMLTGCIEEEFPTDVATQDQVMDSPKAAESLAMAMPAYMNAVLILPISVHYDFGYPAMMHMRDVMTGDMPIVSSNYDHFNSWESCQSIGESYLTSQFTWWYYSKLLQTANLTIGAIDPETENPLNKQFLGSGYAYRAMALLDMARLYEYLPCEKTDPKVAGNPYMDGVTNVTGYTVPIVTENMTEAEGRANPRVTHEAMMEFLINDLDKAEQYINAQMRTSKTMPNLACVYGLKARAYMWDEDYAKAREYARKAIDAHGAGTVTTRDQWLSLTTGFNDLSTPSWMWGQQLLSDDNAVKTGIVNWTSWSSNEYVQGYAASGPFVMIDADLYSKIEDTDFRKLTFVAPAGSALSGQENYINNNYLLSQGVELPEYASLKFKPGAGDMESSTTACAVGIPLMRVEEMYLIEAEAAAQLSPAEGKTLLEDFVKTYRNPKYVCNASSKEEVVDECFLQKRIELFGEGLIFFDYKRLNKSVTRYYPGTNFAVARRYNTEGRPAWMNFVFVQQEASGNAAMVNFNNPDPSGLYTAPVE